MSKFERRLRLKLNLQITLGSSVVIVTMPDLFKKAELHLPVIGLRNSVNVAGSAPSGNYLARLMRKSPNIRASCKIPHLS